MRPERFISKWQGIDLAERAVAQSHFLDLCELLGEPKPLDVDPRGEWYAFEKGATKTTGGEGWADVWKKEHFAWEYKRKGRSLDDALDQLKRYALALDNRVSFNRPALLSPRVASLRRRARVSASDVMCSAAACRLWPRRVSETNGGPR